MKLESAIKTGLKVAAMLLLTIFIVVGGAVMVTATIQGIMGIGLAQTALTFNNWRDAAAGNALANGVAASGLYFDNGTTFDMAPGTTANGLDVDITRMPTAGASQYAIKRDNIAQTSVNLAFGFTSEKVSIETPSTNTDEVCIDWLGATAVCPAANTAGDDRLPAGSTIIIDNFAQTSISVIADSGTQDVFVRAWN